VLLFLRPRSIGAILFQKVPKILAPIKLTPLQPSLQKHWFGSWSSCTRSVVHTTPPTVMLYGHWSLLASPGCGDWQMTSNCVQRAETDSRSAKLHFVPSRPTVHTVARMKKAWVWPWSSRRQINAGEPHGSQPATIACLSTARLYSLLRTSNAHASPTRYSHRSDCALKSWLNGVLRSISTCSKYLNCLDSVKRRGLGEYAFTSLR